MLIQWIDQKVSLEEVQRLLPILQLDLHAIFALTDFREHYGVDKAFFAKINEVHGLHNRDRLSTFIIRSLNEQGPERTHNLNFSSSKVHVIPDVRKSDTHMHFEHVINTGQN